jgi:hypothetical protein
MATSKTPGQHCYEAYCADFMPKPARGFKPWEAMEAVFQRNWERRAENEVRLQSFQVSGLKVLHNGEAVATANTKTMAKRICNALRAYKPGERGF